MDEKRYIMKIHEDRVEIARAAEDYELWPEEFKKDLCTLELIMNHVIPTYQTKKERLAILEKNPVEPRVNWWNTMKCFNWREVNAYFLNCERIKKELAKYTKAKEMLDKQEFPRLVLVEDGLGDGMWRKIEGMYRNGKLVSR